MKHLLIIFSCVLMFSVRAFAALQADAAWEVRTTGTDTNGGCYDTGGSGTDYSQQDPAQLSLTDIVVLEAAPTSVTSVVGGFTSAMVDNCLHINSGTNFTAGWYEITTYTSSNLVTIDRDPTDGDGGDGSAGVGSVGGALLTIDKAGDGYISGNAIYVKSGTYIETVTPATTASDGGSVLWTGYNSTRTDAPTGTNRPLIDCNSSLANGISMGTVSGHIFKNFRIANCTGAGITDSTTTSYASRANAFINVKSSSNTGDGYVRGNSGGGAVFLNSEFASNGGDGADACQGVASSYAHDNTLMGIKCMAYLSISETNASHGFNTTSYNVPYVSNVSNGNTGASTDGFNLSSSSTGNGISGILINNVASNNGRYGFNRVTSNVSNYYVDFNDTYLNSTSAFNNIGTNVRGEGMLTADPTFTDSGNGDYTYASSSTMINTGTPQSVQGATGDYQVSIGVDQDDNVAAGAGAGGLCGF